MVLDDVWVQVGERDLLEGVSWRLMPGQRVGLVGANGAGKSTLMRCMTGIRNVDAGRMFVAPKVEVGYLEQTAVSGSTNTVWEEARSRMTELLEAERMLEEAEEAMYAGDMTAGEKLERAQEAYEAAGGPTSEREITNVLTGLGFKREQFHKPCSEFSGGWQMRIALARLLLGPAGRMAAGGGGGGLLLLDEPTNHLDIESIDSLAAAINDWDGGLVLVSHDFRLISQVCNEIWEVKGGAVKRWQGDIQSYKAHLKTLHDAFSERKDLG